MSIEKITLGGGCFWCFEALFQRIKGIKSVHSGYSGGLIENPNYQQVCTGTTGYAEVIELTFDRDIISLQTLLKIFFSLHNPTTLNQQGADIGTQYRSVIFYHNDLQKMLSEQIISEINLTQQWDSPIVTEISPITIFYPTEDYHHNYYNKNSTQAYCLAVISPKLTQLAQQHPLYFHSL